MLTLDLRFCILSHDVGLGKTVIMLAALVIANENTLLLSQRSESPIGSDSRSSEDLIGNLELEEFEEIEAGGLKRSELSFDGPHKPTLIMCLARALLV